jgi:hypothetical protein
METAGCCAYNLTRNALLSERVVSLSSALDPSQILALILTGPGRDPNSAVFLARIDAPLEIPRIFAFDIAYLDRDQSVIEAATVGPSTPFPVFTQNVTCVLFLPDQELARSGTVHGDLIRICTEDELVPILRSQSQSQPRESTSHPYELPMTIDLRPATLEPFDGSLIYLPSSGPPQPTEIFLRSTAPEARTEEIPSSESEEPINSESEMVEDYPSMTSTQPAGTQELQSPTEPPPFFPLPIRFFDPAASSQPQQPAAPQRSIPLHSKATERLKDILHLRSEPAPPIQQDFAPTPAQSLPEIESSPEPEFIVDPQFDPPIVREEITLLQNEETELQIQPDDSVSLPAFSPDLETDFAFVDPTETEPQLVHLVPQNEIPPPASHQHDQPETLPLQTPPEKVPLATRVQRWLGGDSVSLSGNRRRGERISLPGLVAFYWTGGAPAPYEIANISASGLYLRGQQMWSPNTLVRMTLERHASPQAEKKSITVLARVVRIDDGGGGHEFITSEVLANLRIREFLPEHGTNRKELEKFLSPRL